MLNVAQTSRLRFIKDSDTPLHKVMISAPLPWLTRLMETQDGMPALRNFFGQHLAHFSFEPGQHILQLAEKIMHPPALLSGELSSLYLKAQALDIMWQSCLALVADDAGGWQAPTLMSLRHCERVRDFIIANLENDLSIDLIAGEAGASTSTIQRHFKEHWLSRLQGLSQRGRAIRIPLATPLPPPSGVLAKLRLPCLHRCEASLCQRVRSIAEVIRRPEEAVRFNVSSTSHAEGWYDRFLHATAWTFSDGLCHARRASRGCSGAR